MPLKDNSKTSGFTPKSSKGIGKSDNMKTKKEGTIDNYGTLMSATQSNPIPVVVLKDAPFNPAIEKEQTTLGRQVYAVQVKDNNGVVTEVCLARNNDAGELTVLGWCDIKFVICGVLANKEVDINQNSPVQGEPETIPITDISEDKPLRSFVFFDPYMNGEKIAYFLGLYNGKIPDSNKKKEELQEKISKQIFIVPFNDIPDEIINTYPELSAFQKSGINGKIDGYRERIRDYWNNNVALVMYL